MYLKPLCISEHTLDDATLKADKMACKKYGPCGVGQKALYLNHWLIDRHYYIPFTSIERVYKRIAMSKGGFTGKGIFGSIPYLVVVYDNGKERQFTFKHEEDVDHMLSRIGTLYPQMKRMSVVAEEKLRKRDEERAAMFLPNLSTQAQESIAQIQQALSYLEKAPELSDELSLSARRKRALLISKPAYRWVALAITLFGLFAFIYGIVSWMQGGEFAIYFTLFGLAGIFFFSGANVLPTARNNRKAILARAEQAQKEMEQYLEKTENFPIPARYAHPIVLNRMERVIRQGRAMTTAEALDVVKTDLKALNATVEVEQDEYDEVVTIKAMFLVEDYR